MATLADMRARIATEIARDDIDDRITAAIKTAVAAYQQDRFRFNEPSLATAPTFNTVVGRTTYTSVDNANIGTLYAIDLLTFVDGGGSVFEIRRDDSLEVRMEQYPNFSGMPDGFTYRGNALTIYPIPNQVWTVTMDGLTCAPSPTTDVEANNPWMNDAERLIRCRAKYEIAVHVTRNEKMAAMMSPEVNSTGESWRAYRDLKRQANRVRSKGRVTPMNL
jgi:hypothetical protein